MFPEALTCRPQWVLFQLLEVPGKQGELKLTKIPVNPRTLKYGSSTNPKTWGTYDACVAVLPRALVAWTHTPPTEHDEKPATYQGAGIGFVFTVDDPYMLVDLDHSVAPETGVIAPWAQTLIDTLNSYTQRSVSGKGLHVLVQAKMPTEDKQHGDVQMWDQKRFVAMTGWHLPATPRTIESRQSQLAMVHTAHILLPKAKAEAKAAKTRTTQARTSTAAGAPRLTDQEILTIASRAKNSAKFNALWAGDTSGYTSPSEADEALLCILTFYTKDKAQLDALFRQSGLMDDKWDARKDYRDRTIAHALATVTESYDPVAYAAEQAAIKARNGHEKTPQTPPEAPTEDAAVRGKEDPALGKPFTLAAFLAHLEALDTAQRPQAVVDAMEDLATLSTTTWMLAKSAIKKLAPDVNLNDLRTARKEMLHAAKAQARADALTARPAWQQTLFYAEGDGLQETDNNLQAIFAHHPEWQERLSWDVVANKAYIDDQPLDIHYIRNEVSPWLGRAMRMPVRHSQRVLEVMRSWAQRLPRDPIQEWLEALPETDTEDPERLLLETWLIRYAGAEDTPYTRFISRILPVSLTKRAQSPGVQYRYVVVLEGEENLGKTKLLRILGDRWHQEFPKTVEGKEAYMQLQGYWLVELGELDALKPAQESRIKMFISQQMDVWVPKYENDVIERPRRAILVGTTNEREYLKGEHGNTRYLPLWLHGPIQHAAIAHVRDRLFTQAKYFLAEHPDDWWCIPDEVEKEVTQAREMRKEPSVFEDAVRAQLLNRQECTIAELFEAFSIPKDRWTKKLEMDLGKALKDVGWYRHIEWDPQAKKTTRTWKPYPQLRSACIHEHVNTAGVCNDCGQAV
jgi:predicted P-loop ATPase